MANDPPKCDVCGALITEKRGGELVVRPGNPELVWVHPQCRPGYSRANDARWAFLALSDDPLEIDRDGWVPMASIEQQRGLWGSDGADFAKGLSELVARGWVESNAEKSSFRLTPAGFRQQETLA